MTTSLLQQAVERLGPDAALDLLSPEERAAAAYLWPLVARPSQLPPPGDWDIWAIITGRRWGKTRTGSQWISEAARNCAWMALVAPTAADLRAIMVSGPSGILTVSPPWWKPVYEPSKRLLTWPNGSRAYLMSADRPDRLRGGGYERLWCDEFAAWSHAKEAWELLDMTLSEGRQKPKTLITSTPKPLPILRSILTDFATVTVRGSTYENRANLAPGYLERMQRQYEGTRIGRQELHGELLDDVEGALWLYGWIADNRVAQAPELERVVVAIDPAVTHGPDSDETGLCVAGRGIDGDFYVLHGAGYRLSPDGWATKAIGLFDHHEADRVIGERNNGGEMVEATLRQIRPDLPITTIHASRGKRVRAEPVVALYEQGRVHHVGIHQTLEDQMVAFTGAAGDEDDQVDALVYAVAELAQPRRRYSYRVTEAG